MSTTNRLKRRAARVRTELKRYGLDALLVTARSNVSYLTGFRGTQGAVLVTPQALDLVVDFRYYEQAASEAPAARRVLVEGARYDAAICEAIRQAGGRRVGFEADHLTVAEHMALGTGLTGVDLVPSRGLVEVARAIKDEEEIAMIRRAAAITSEAVADALGAARPGMTERELAGIVEAGFRARGADGPAFPTLVAGGPRAALPHPRPGDRPFEDGDWILVDAGACVGGYRADMSRSFVLGSPTPAQAAAWQAVRDALAAGLAAIRPGRPAGAIDEACRKVLRSRGYERLFGHDAGHGVGLDLHEMPRLGRGSDEVLEAGMVVTVEPGLYEPGVGGVRLEELALVTPHGAELLTTAPLALYALPSLHRS
jgi:Xaa-Pro aminopeptidase